MRRIARELGWLAWLVVMALPATAAAQAHVQVLGGVTSAAEQNPFFGGAIGGRLGAIEVDAEVGRFTDLLPKGVLDLANQLQQQKGLPIQGIASVPATYATAMVRVIPGIGPVRPFFGAGGGVARLEPRIDVTVNGISFGDVFGLTSFQARTKPMALATAGLRFGGGAAHVEVGYRYILVFSDFRKGLAFGDTVVIHANAIYGAVGFGF